jgi:hypothetical protein
MVLSRLEFRCKRDDFAHIHGNAMNSRSPKADACSAAEEIGRGDRAPAGSADAAIYRAETLLPVIVFKAI